VSGADDPVGVDVVGLPTVAPGDGAADEKVEAEVVEHAVGDADRIAAGSSYAT
jgi:hypothetical protein